MRLPVPFIQLPVSFDAAALAAEIRALGDGAWRPHPEGFAGNSALALIAVNGNPESNSIAGPMRATPHLRRCPYLMHALATIGAVWGRSRLMRLSGQAEVTAHVDTNYYWRERMRVHVPIVTQPSVRFICGDAELNMAPGECWIFDTWRRHRVINAADDERIHLVADTVGGARFWQHVDRGCAPNAPIAGWQAQPVPEHAGGLDAIDFESVNVPIVMTPWEIREHINFLLGDAVAHPQVPGAQRLCSLFIRDWQSLWSRYGEASAGWPEYRARLDAFASDLHDYADRIVLRNEAVLVNSLELMVLRVALADRPMPARGDEYRQKLAPRGSPVHDADADGFERPVFIVSPPRSGSTLLFETLAKAPNVYTIGSESHAIFEGLPQLNIAAHGYASNQLEAATATAQVVADLRERFRRRLIDRDGKAPGASPVRLLEKTPKNALRVPFLMRAFPQARFVYLYRDARETLASMLEAWNSGRFITYPELPDWSGPAWSLLLIPGWAELAGKPLREIVAAQWETTTRILIDDLESLPADRVCIARYDALLADPQAEITRLCAAVGFAWDRPLDATLPISQHTLSAPEPHKWRRHAQDIEAVLARLAPTIARAERFAARRPDRVG
ncbi:MAG: sulfotransferase [Rudaea sp.]|nr:sulfotransferase [Rudaea sp.]